MGGGGQQGEDTAPQRPFRHRRRPTSAVDTGLDRPPSIASPRGQPRSLRIRTPQYLATLLHPYLPADSEESSRIQAGTAPCDPIIGFGRYVISATNDGRVCFYSVNMDSDPSFPEAVVELDPHSTIVSLVAAPTGVSLVRYRSAIHHELTLKPPDLYGHVVAISSEGDVNLLECIGKEVKNLYSWNTGTCNASCVTVRPDCNGYWRICLGYESGCLEEWKVSIPVRETKHDGKEAADNEHDDEEDLSRNNATAQSDWEPLMRRVVPKLLCRGFFDHPIRSISSLGTMRSGQDIKENHFSNESDVVHGRDVAKDTAVSESISNQKEDDTHETKSSSVEKRDESSRLEDPVNETGDFLAVCLTMSSQASEIFGRPPSSSQVEVINVAGLERDWMLQEQNNPLALADYCVWPDTEILDTASLSMNDSDGRCRLSRRLRSLPSRGSDRMCAHDGAHPFFAAALSDGMIAVMHAKFADGSLRWGVNSSQIALSFPAIGIASVTLSTGSHVACCLRGGTVYLVPENDTPVTAILAPVERESSTQYLQGFHAGNLLVEGTTCYKGLPVLVYSGAGGILQVYSCELLSQTEQDSVLRELVENGSVSLFRDFLCSLRDEDPLLIMDLWNLARDEFLQANDAPTLSMLRSASFANTRHLLIKLSEVDDSNQHD